MDTETRASTTPPETAITSAPAAQETAITTPPNSANFPAPSPAHTTEQRSTPDAPERARDDATAGRGSANDRNAHDGGPDAQPASASARRRSPRQSRKQQARLTSQEVANLAAPAGLATRARNYAPNSASITSPSSPASLCAELEQQAAAAPPETAKGRPPAGEIGANAPAPDMANTSPPLSPAFICAELVALQRRRRFSIKMQSRIDRGLEAALARQLGYRTDLPKVEGRKIFARVAAVRSAVINNDQLADLNNFEWALARDWRYEIAQTEQSRSGWDFQRNAVEERMRGYAEQLPVWEWAAGIRGFTSLGLAVIVGEACGPTAPELGDYRSPQNLCKRLAIGVVDGHRQGSPGTGATADDWIREGYKKERRAEIWTILDFSLRNAQWRNEGGPLGAYGAIYARQIGEYERREWKHAKKAAARFMAKCLIRDLWRAWRGYTRAAEGAEATPPETGPRGSAPIDDRQAAELGTPEMAKVHAPPAGTPPEPAYEAITVPPQGQDVRAPDSGSQQVAIARPPDGAKETPPSAVPVPEPTAGAEIPSPGGQGLIAPDSGPQRAAKARPPERAGVHPPPAADIQA